MELEQRVKTLEYEFKILKNEIQRTLLDIQEQILVHYYPALRTDETGPSDGTIQAIEAIRAKQGVQSVPAAAPAAPAAPPPAPVVKKVSLDDIRASREGAAPAAAAAVPPAPAPVVPPPAAPAPTATALADQASVANLMGWVMNCAGKIGSANTGKLIEACGGKGIIASGTKQVLLQLATLNNQVPTEKVPVNEILTAMLKLDELLGRVADAEEALALIEEAKLG